MHPDVRAAPLRGQGCLPYLDQPLDVDLVSQLIDGRARLVVPGRDGPTSVEAVRAWHGPTVGAGSLRTSKQVPEVLSEAVTVGHADDRGGFTLEPFVDRPRSGEAAPGPALGNRARYLDR